MARFHDLTVTDVANTTRDAVVVTLMPDNTEAFAFRQGQYLTFRRMFGDEELRRSYSICTGLDDGVIQVGIKKVEGGAFSSWANDELNPGVTLEAMPPMGNFYAPLNPDAGKHYLCFAAGSGITPILSIIKTVLVRELGSRITLVFANRGVNTIMFREELADLKNLHLGRLNIIHILKSDVQEIDLFTGRIDTEKCNALFSHWIDVSSVDTAFICGPEPMMVTIADSLREHGLADSQIKFELFATAQPGRLPKKKIVNGDASGLDKANASVVIDGTVRSFAMRKDQTILEAALENSLDAPFACRAGVCSTCRCKIVEGKVEMAANHALEDYEVDRGYALSCQSFPLTDTIVVDYDQ